MVNGQINLRDAIRRKIDFESNGKSYRLSQNPAVLIVRYANPKLVHVNIQLYCVTVPEAGTSMNLG